jgi:hypothetical protein
MLLEALLHFPSTNSRHLRRLICFLLASDPTPLTMEGVMAGWPSPLLNDQRDAEHPSMGGRGRLPKRRPDAWNWRRWVSMVPAAALNSRFVDHGLVLVGDGDDRRRQAAHDVKVGHRQQLGLAFGEPLFGGAALVAKSGSTRGRLLFATPVRSPSARSLSCHGRRRTQTILRSTRKITFTTRQDTRSWPTARRE